MADKEINDLTDGGYADDDDLVHVVRSGNSRKAKLRKQLPATPASSAGPASVQFAEDTDNGSNKITLQAPSSIAADVTETVGGGKGTAIASAATIAIGGEKFYHVTGTTTITDIDFTSGVDGAWAWLEFDGALTLTHNATSLNLPGGANIVTLAGDRALVVQDNGDNVHVLAYERADGRSLGSGSVIDSVHASYATNTSITTAIPIDDTKPQSSEGTQILSVSITPKSTTNKLRCRFSGCMAVGGTESLVAFIITTAGGADAVAAWYGVANSGYTVQSSIEFEYTPATLSAQTSSVRVGPQTSSIRMNGAATTRYLGGALASILTVEEIKA